MPQEKEVVIWSSDDFLATSTRISTEHTVAAGMTMGAGAGGTRNIAGNSPVHLMIESKLADFHDKDAGLLVTSRHVAHEAAVTTLAQLLPECGVFLQQYASPAIEEATRRANKAVYHFKELGDLQTCLSNTNHKSRLVVVESMSCSGRIAKLRDLRDIVQQHGGLLVVDETRALGVYGKTGRGLLDAEQADDAGILVIGSLDGTLGGLMMGGYVVGKASTIDSIRSYASSFIFTTALPPAVIKCAAVCLDEVKVNEAGRADLALKVLQLRSKLDNASIPMMHPNQVPTAILCIPITNADLCQRAATTLVEHGILVEALVPPKVPDEEVGLRINPTLAHTEVMMDDLCHAIKAVNSRLELW